MGFFHLSVGVCCFDYAEIETIIYTSSYTFLFGDICFSAHTFIKMSQSQVKKILEMNFSFIPPLAVITLIHDIKQIYQTYFFVA